MHLSPSKIALSQKNTNYPYIRNPAHKQWSNIIISNRVRIELV
ncbi:hypothetical protein RINTHM_10410 [Richelia intracellularis HM01]|nr:hypothetical protein RINTHM_10410 [Richelia intracellularis HM01]